MNKVTLVIDWDGTLAFTSLVDSLPEKVNQEPDEVISVNMNGVEGTTHLFIRPYAEAFLKTVSQKYNLILWSFGVRLYIKQCLDVTGWRSFFQKVIVRENMQLPLKDLAAIEPTLTRIAIVDDNNDRFGQLNPYNCIDIPSWRPNQSRDCALQVLPGLIDLHFDRILAKQSSQTLLDLRRGVFNKRIDITARDPQKSLRF